MFKYLVALSMIIAGACAPETKSHDELTARIQDYLKQEASLRASARLSYDHARNSESVADLKKENERRGIVEKPPTLAEYRKTTAARLAIPADSIEVRYHQYVQTTYLDYWQRRTLYYDSTAAAKRLQADSLKRISDSLKIELLKLSGS